MHEQEQCVTADQCTAHNVEGLQLKQVQVLYLLLNTSYMQPLN
jgi:hypothetical protein